MTADVVFEAVEDWPLLLLGPMVRKVTRTDAHIFVATKFAADARILVHDRLAQHDRTPDATGTMSTLQPIGEHLHVGLLHVSLPNPEPDKLYSYDIEITVDGQSTPVGLYDLDLLGPRSGHPVDTRNRIEAHIPLGYSDGTLPSFLTPPDDNMALRLVHASCRKPHGNTVDLEADALPIVDDLIWLSKDPSRVVEDNDASYIWLDKLESHVAPPAYPPPELHVRPHQLILTGDQIYADDVAPAMLDAISDAAAKLMGWTEHPPGIIPGVNGFLVNPGWRTRYLSLAGVKEIPAEGDTDYAQSHLLTFGEWCAMYCMAWSTALWPRSEDGSKVELRPHSQRVKVANMIENLQWYVDNPYIKKPPGSAQVTQAIKVLSLVKRLDKFEQKIDDKWEATIGKAKCYGSTIPYVRRVLANTPTYMMFDDHEVTDDWFVDRDVAERLIGIGQPSSAWWSADVGPRILRNGLSSYAIFQHWGNVPDDFAGWDVPAVESTTSGSVGQRLLTMWKPGADAGGERPPLAGPEPSVSPFEHFIEGFPWWALAPDFTPTWDEADENLTQLVDGWINGDAVEDPATRAADELLRIDTMPTDDDGHHPSGDDPADRVGFGRFRWDYAIEFDSHRLISLDTRTWRRFPTTVGLIPPLSTVLQGSRAEARAATTTDLVALAAAWRTDSAAVADEYADLLDAVVAVADAASDAALDHAMTELADTVDAFADAISLSGQVRVTVDLRIGDYRAELDGTAEFSARFTLASEDEKIARVAALLRELAEAVDTDATHGYVEMAVRVWLACGRYLEAIAGSSPRQATHELHQLLYDAGSRLIEPGGPLEDLAATTRDAVLTAISDADASLRATFATYDVDARSDLFFRDGTGYLAAELISAPAMEWMVTEPIQTVGTSRETVILSPAPMFGDDIFEGIQRALVVAETLRGKAGAEEWEYEAWTANPVGFDNLMVAAKDLVRCVVLSGDVHYAYSMVNRARLRSGSVDTCYIQLTSSSSKNSETVNKRIGLGTDAFYSPDGKFIVSQFSPLPVLRRGWDYFDPDATGAFNRSGDDVGASFMGWLLEFAVEKLNDEARNYGLDDLDLARREAKQVSNFGDYAHWWWRWFYAPAGRGLIHGVLQAPRYVEEAFAWLRHAPVHSFVAWLNEVTWMNLAYFHWWDELRKDPEKKIFGHYLYAKDVLLQQLSDIYRAIGVDPYFGLQVEKQSLRDRRVDRMVRYGGRLRFKGKPRNTYLYGHDQEVQVVGNANIGVVRFVLEPNTDRLGIQHDLLFYPFGSHPNSPEPPSAGPWDPQDIAGPDPGEVTGWSAPRDDWMGTQHTGYFPHEALRNQISDQPGPSV